jgi:transcriptional regulator with XRE-family HTH domain
MEKSIYSEEYAVFLAKLREARRAAGLTQAELGARLGQTQSFVSKCERGERRIDIAELAVFCRALNVGFQEFASRLESAWRT